MRKILLIIIFLSCALWADARYTMVADTLKGSAHYPGTVHAMQVSIPEIADTSRPAGLYVGLDGILCRAPQVLDSLVTLGVIPPMVGVYLQPGEVRRDGMTVQYNRSNEFDATDARFAEFLASEILPRVDSILSADGRGITITDNSADRMIYGLSSGGIAAFVAAWHRPDLFGKVFTGCGTYVPMRGGHNLQAIVRKHEPKPLRIFMQDGSNDAWNPLFGSWYEANRVLATALQFAGYDCAFKWDDSGHSEKPSAEIFPEVIRWMWRDGSAEMLPGVTSNDYLRGRLPSPDAPDYNWQPMQSVPPLQPRDVVEAIYPDSTLVVCVEPGTNFLTQYVLDADGNRSCGQRYYWLHTYDNSALNIVDMIFDGDGNLWVLTNAGVQICDQNGRVRAILSLPPGESLAETTHGRIVISDGFIILTVDDHAYRRTFAVKAATSGVRPASQGAG